MSYKPNEKDWMAYLYGELEGEEKERFDQYLLQDPQARLELEKYKGLRNILSTVKDKEVIAPPIVLGDNKQRYLWDAPYFKTIVSIAASLLIIILVGKLTGTSLSVSGNELKLTFGEPKVQSPALQQNQAALTSQEVQQMIDASLENNNTALASEWKNNEAKLTASVRKNLELNSGKIDALVREASRASQNQIRDYVAGLQTENMQMVKNYFQLTSSEQKTYIENLLVDFSEYLQQQRNNDLQLVQMQMQNLEQNTNVFKQETEQILSSIITSVGTPVEKETKN
jgi:hypothetical protein